jgi:integrase
MAKRTYGDGGIDQRGDGVFRLRYRVGSKRFAVAFKGTKDEARKELRRLLKSSDDGTHIDPNKVTVAGWVDQWLALLERNPGAGTARRRGLVSARTLERYQQLLNLHVKPTLGDVVLQKLNGTMIDKIYMSLEGRLAVRTVLHVHVTLKACLGAALRKRLIASNPAEDAEAPNPENKNVATVLDEDQLAALVRGFTGHPLEGVVTIAALTGARRNEILALRWQDIDLDRKTMTICRAIEQTVKHGGHIKGPKSARGIRTIAIDDVLVDRLRGYRDQQKRLVAGVPDGTEVNLNLIRLPEGCLLFPGEPAPGKDIDMTKLRDALAVTRTFVRRAARLGFKMRFHDIRASHLTILLDRGEPVHVVAARAGHDAGVLLRNYAKWTKKADAKVAQTIGAISKGLL